MLINPKIPYSVMVTEMAK